MFEETSTYHGRWIFVMEWSQCQLSRQQNQLNQKTLYKTVDFKLTNG